ncbi:MAG: 2-C-methyl-D-erythritol 2,4-cyclodiphosphate synthase [Candidatus Omnitrophica bacterium]|nr:2-C-methyl-D-erythritol 2,4-cyclodiphosphate synthase [Candidatus Omnitrophota bacterium]MDD5574798.1 2-C-methyl-D-erythritol 2,4-cyclodiphosphate synthase [Candidatus Omnitrophota bacterium]
MDYRIGFGYDIHKFALKRKLMLGGVNIPFTRGLLGHSDADVVLHALCDALLGALGEGDIGRHFPPGDPAYRNIQSLTLLKHVARLLQKKHFAVRNADVMVILEKPKISPFVAEMRKRIGAVLKADRKLISIKATTHEGLGSIGAGKAAAAYAVALIVKTRS